MTCVEQRGRQPPATGCRPYRGCRLIHGAPLSLAITVAGNQFELAEMLASVRRSDERVRLRPGQAVVLVMCPWP